MTAWTKAVEAAALSDIQFDGYDDAMAISAGQRERYRARAEAALGAALASLAYSGAVLTGLDMVKHAIATGYSLPADEDTRAAAPRLPGTEET